MMKKIILSICTLALLLVSCSGDDNATPSNQNSAIVGNYILTSLMSDVAVDFDQDMNTDTQLMNESTCFSQMTVGFDAAGNFTSTVVEVSFDTNNVLVCTASTETGTYVYNNGALTITLNVNGGTATESQQVTLTATTLSFNVDDTDISQYFSNAAGTPASGITSLDFVYTKI